MKIVVNIRSKYQISCLFEFRIQNLLQLHCQIQRRIYLINLAIGNTLIKLHPHIILLLQLLISMKILSDFNENIEFTSTPLPRTNRNRKIIWFNPPYSVNVKTKVGRIFLRLIDKLFSRHHKYGKLFNRNHIKISYSCMLNMASVIQSHNTSLLKDPIPTDIKECSCRQKPKYPLDKKCLSGYLVYKSLVDGLETNQTNHYYRTCEKNFKERYTNHTASFIEIKVKKKVLNSQNTSES